MKLRGTLKEKVEKAESLADAKQEIARAGMELTDEEMAEVAGGGGVCRASQSVGNHEATGGRADIKGEFGLAKKWVYELVAEYKSPNTAPSRRTQILYELQNGTKFGVKLSSAMTGSDWDSINNFNRSL